MIAWHEAFALTVAVELPCVALTAGDGRRRRAAGDSVLVNLLTHPLAWLAVGSGTLSFAVTEVLVTATEAAVYRGITGLSSWRAILTSCVANGATIALSFVV